MDGLEITGKTVDTVRTRYTVLVGCADLVNAREML